MAPLSLRSKLRLLYAGLGLLVLALAALALAKPLGIPVSDREAANATNVVMAAAIAILLYHRKLRADEAKARKARDDGARNASEEGPADKGEGPS